MRQNNWHIAHLEHLSSPWGPAGGVAKNAETVEALLETEVGFVEHGSTSLEPRSNPENEVTYAHNPKTGETFNSVRLANEGLDVVLGYMPDLIEQARTAGKPIIWNLVPTSDEPIEETRELVLRTYEAGAEAILVDVSCPTVEVKDKNSPEDFRQENWTIRRILGALAEAGVGVKYPRVFIRIRSHASYSRAKTAFKVIEASKAASAIFVNNTWPYRGNNHGLIIPAGAGVGLSGPAMADKAATQTAWESEIVNGSGVEVVSCCGITTAEELVRRLGMRAVVAGSGTTFYRESEDWQRDTAILNEKLQTLL